MKIKQFTKFLSDIIQSEGGAHAGIVNVENEDDENIIVECEDGTMFCVSVIEAEQDEDEDEDEDEDAF